MKGFLLSSYEPLKAMLNNSHLEIRPPEGSYAFIYDYENFSIPEDVLVMGIIICSFPVNKDDSDLNHKLLLCSRDAIERRSNLVIIIRSKVASGHL